jgi:hypothetical protein
MGLWKVYTVQCIVPNTLYSALKSNLPPKNQFSFVHSVHYIEYNTIHRIKCIEYNAYNTTILRIQSIEYNP